MRVIAVPARSRIVARCCPPGRCHPNDITTVCCTAAGVLYCLIFQCACYFTLVNHSTCIVCSDPKSSCCLLTVTRRVICIFRLMIERGLEIARGDAPLIQSVQSHFSRGKARGEDSKKFILSPEGIFWQQTRFLLLLLATTVTDGTTVMDKEKVDKMKRLFSSIPGPETVDNERDLEDASETANQNLVMSDPCDIFLGLFGFMYWEGGGRQNSIQNFSNHSLVATICSELCREDLD